MGINRNGQIELTTYEAREMLCENDGRCMADRCMKWVWVIWSMK